MRTLTYLSSYAAALVVSAVVLPMVIRLAPRIGAMDRPGGRRVHSGEISRLGGIGIFLGFVTGVSTSLLVAGHAHSVGDPAEFRWYGAAIGACLIFASGLLDDIIQLSPRIKFSLQLLSAVIAVAMGVRIEALSSPFGANWELGMLGPVITVAWILLVTNAINLIDGLDGLAGGVVLIVTATVASVAIARDQFSIVVTALALGGALTGFLYFNFSPARIFMGDGGSQFLGFVIAVIAIRGSQKSVTSVAVMVPLLALGLPLLDVMTTIVRRATSAMGPDEATSGFRPHNVLRRVSRADRKHLHHNLLDLGLSHRRAVLVLYLIAALFALSGYLSLVQNSVPLAVLTACLSVGAVAAIKALVGSRRTKRARRALRRRTPERETLSG